MGIKSVYRQSLTLTDFQAGHEIAADDLETASRRTAGRTTESAGALPQGDDGLVAFTGGGCVSGISNSPNRRKTNV